MSQIQVKCPKCGKWQNAKARTCIDKNCKFGLGKRSNKEYRIDYRDMNGERVREKIGPSKEAAEQRLRECLSAIAEGKHIRKSPDTFTKFRTLADWYLKLPEVEAKRSYDRDVLSVNRLLPYFGDRLLKDITPGIVEAYRRKRLGEPSGRSPKDSTKPATVNREIACLKTIFNKAVKDNRADRNPCQGVKMLKENNERDRVLTPEEYARLLVQCPAHLKPIVKLAYHTGMRQGEILNLTWGQVDIKEGFIKLNPEDCKTNEGRLIPLTDGLVGTFKIMPRRLPRPGQTPAEVKVFTYKDRPVGSIKRAFETAVKNAGLMDFTFHDLRHTAINNWRLQGHDYFRIMAVSGHKTMHVFKRYNTVSREELKALAGK